MVIFGNSEQKATTDNKRLTLSLKNKTKPLISLLDFLVRDRRHKECTELLIQSQAGARQDWEL